MPRIFDNINLDLLTALRETIQVSDRADFCVGYFNLRGWKGIGELVEEWASCEGHCVRLLVGMQRLPQDELHDYYRLLETEDDLDNATKLRLKKKLAEEFRNQLTIGAPTNDDETALRKLAEQIKSKKVVVKLFLRHPLHAKLYLLFRQDVVAPIVGYMGSSNLTLAGLSKQGELNVDVLDQDACNKLSKWFTDRWEDWGTIDISDDLVEIIGQSWAREEPVTPYQIYIKMAYHLSQEARSGLNEFRIPKDFGNKLFPFQVAAVKIAAHHLNKRGGVLIGDVVGLGKTLMATAVARIFEDDQDLETLIICPKNLVPMWEKYRDNYRLRAKVLSISMVTQKLTDLKRYRLLILDESHNLRNREGRRYRAIRDYIEKNECRCILLTATPYNKTYLDLSNQLRLFIPEERDLGVRPERFIREIGETQLGTQYQCAPRTLAAFEHSPYTDDWRELMRLFMVRRTRSFITQNYAKTDPDNGRKYLALEDGTRYYFPIRIPRTLKFNVNEDDPADTFARMYSTTVVDAINALELPRYGLGGYQDSTKLSRVSTTERDVLADLTKAGKRLKGFCRTNLFKRLESSGYVFLESLRRHILRNYIFLYALENNQPLPIGTQDADLLDPRVNDEDVDLQTFFDLPDEDETPSEMVDAEDTSPNTPGLIVESDFQKQAQEVYALYARAYKRRFKWIRSDIFLPSLTADLRSDAQRLIAVLNHCGEWDWHKDAKLQRLADLLIHQHPNDKVLIFTQFADTVRYLEEKLRTRGVLRLAGVAGSDADPTQAACRFSPNSNEMGQKISPGQELRVLVATDVLSEGQNLQDGWIVVNYDLPWAIVRLIQRAGRVDRIGQKSEQVLCYSFLPADGVENILRLRNRVRSRLKQNAEVVGTDEVFFEDDISKQALTDLYSEKAGILDMDEEGEIDLSSYAYQIWKNAIDRNPSIRKTVEDLPGLVYSAKTHIPSPGQPNGVLVYVHTSEDNDVLSWINPQGQSVTESQFEILRAAECEPETPTRPRSLEHHDLVKKGVADILRAEHAPGGQLGKASSARYRTYERLNNYIHNNEGTLFVTAELRRAVDDIYRFPLREGAKDTLNRQLRAGIQDQQLAELVVSLRSEDRLCIVEEEQREPEAKIVCSLGLVS